MSDGGMQDHSQHETTDAFLGFIYFVMNHFVII